MCLCRILEQLHCPRFFTRLMNFLFRRVYLAKDFFTRFNLTIRFLFQAAEEIIVSSDFISDGLLIQFINSASVNCDKVLYFGETNVVEVLSFKLIILLYILINDKHSENRTFFFVYITIGVSFLRYERCTQACIRCKICY